MTTATRWGFVLWLSLACAACGDDDGDPAGDDDDDAGDDDDDQPPPPVGPVPREGAVIRVDGRQVLVDDEPLEIRGVCWSPVDRGNRPPPDFTGFVDVDAPMMQAAGINAVRVYSPIADRSVLDTLADHGIWVIASVYAAAGDNVDASLAAVRAAKDHPAILMWSVGNEWNYNGLFAGLSLDDARDRVEEVAGLIQDEDADHPVATIYGEVPPESVVDSLPSIDVWGINVYRGLRFFGLFEQYDEVDDRPLFLAEYGADAYDVRTDRPNESAQAVATRTLTEEWIDASVVRSPDGIVFGGTIFEWSDEWWKDEEGDPDVHDTGGSAPGGGPYPDGAFNEEWWGIVDIDRTPRPAYDALRTIYVGDD